MKEKEYNNNFEEMDIADYQELTDQIKEGFTSGRLDNAEGRHIYWDLRVNVWKD